jgi:hypothetical protein
VLLYSKSEHWEFACSPRCLNRAVVVEIGEEVSAGCVRVKLKEDNECSFHKKEHF